MKRILPVVFFLFAGYSNLQANTMSPVKGRMISKEVNSSSGKIKTEVHLFAYDTVYVKDLKFSQKNGSQKDGDKLSCTGMPPFVQYDKLLPGQTAVYRFDITYDKRDLPFYPQEITIEIQYYTPDNILISKPPKNPHHGNVIDPDQADYIEVKGMIYFTPYGTAELWDIADYYNLKRVWLSESASDPTHKNISKKSIPISNIDGSVNPSVNEWQDEWNLSFVEGLAYAIPMKRNNAATAYSGNGKHLVEYHYLLKGHAVSSFIDDLGDTEKLNLDGLEIRFYENNDQASGDDQYLGRTTIEEDGSFTFNLDVKKPAQKGTPIAIYYTIQAFHPGYDIKAITNFGDSHLHSFVRKETGGLIRLVPTMQTAVIEMNIDVRDDAHRAVAYAARAMDFCIVNAVEVPGGLTIWPYSRMNPVSVYLPAGYSGEIPQGLENLAEAQPIIYIDGVHSGNENILYHEFGHHLLYSTQGRTTVNASEMAAFHEDREENPELAWNEGWANGFMAMCDMAYFNVDREYQFDRGRNREQNVIYPKVSKGFNNIGYISRTLFDLFDGQDKMAAYQVNGNLWTHADEWTNAMDGVSMSLKDICLPLMDANLNNVNKYFLELIKSADCKTRQSIKAVFDNNLIGINENGRLTAGLSSDEIGYHEANPFHISATDIWGTGRIEKRVESGVYLDIAHLTHINFNIAGNPDFQISDPLVVGDAAKLVFNGGMTVGLFGDDASSVPRFAINASFCEGIRLDAKMGSSIEIGDPGTGNEAKVQISDASLLSVEAGAKLFIHDGSALIVEAGGSLWIKKDSEVILTGESSISIMEGGYICVEPGASITLSDPASLIVANPSLIVGTNPLLGLSGFCQEIGDIVTSGPGKITSGGVIRSTLAFDGINDYVMAENVGELNLNTGDFTMEARFQSAIPDSANLHQIILSKRSNDIYQTTDGFLVGLWSNGEDAGRLLVQLANVPNFLYGPNLFDRRCHHIVIARENNLVHIYIDGVFYGSMNSARNIYSPSSLYIGYDKPTRLSFNGSISDVRIWNRALSADEIDWSGSGTGSQEGLTAFWQAGEAPSQFMPDLSPNNVIATLGPTDQVETNDPVWAEQTCDAIKARPASTRAPQLNIQNPYDSAVYREDLNLIDIYPNPFREELKIKVSSIQALPLSLVIRDVFGNEVYHSTDHETNEEAIIYQEWEEGLYIITAIYGNIVKEIKAMKTR